MNENKATFRSIISTIIIILFVWWASHMYMIKKDLDRINEVMSQANKCQTAYIHAAEERMEINKNKKDGLFSKYSDSDAIADINHCTRDYIDELTNIDVSHCSEGFVKLWDSFLDDIDKIRMEESKSKSMDEYDIGRIDQRTNKFNQDVRSYLDKRAHSLF